MAAKMGSSLNIVEQADMMFVGRLHSKSLEAAFVGAERERELTEVL